MFAEGVHIVVFMMLSTFGFRQLSFLFTSFKFLGIYDDLGFAELPLHYL